MALLLVGYEVIGREAMLIGLGVAPRHFVRKGVPLSKLIFLLRTSIPMKEDRSMAKRKDDSDDESPHRKRQKITKDLALKAEIQTVQTSKDLSLLLSFEQDAGPRTRQSIAQCIHIARVILIF